MEVNLKWEIRQSRQTSLRLQPAFCQSPSLLVHLLFLSRLSLFFLIRIHDSCPFMSAACPDLASLASSLRTVSSSAGTYDPSSIRDGIRPDLTMQGGIWALKCLSLFSLDSLPDMNESNQSICFFFFTEDGSAFYLLSLSEDPENSDGTAVRAEPNSSGSKQTSINESAKSDSLHLHGNWEVSIKKPTNPAASAALISSSISSWREVSFWKIRQKYHATVIWIKRLAALFQRRAND